MNAVFTTNKLLENKLFSSMKDIYSLLNTST